MGNYSTSATQYSHVVPPLVNSPSYAGAAPRHRKATGRQHSVFINGLVAATFCPAFLILLLPFAAFYNPADLSLQFYIVTIIYVVCCSLDLLLYFKALEVGDISIISPMLTLAIVTNLIGTYFILGQHPSLPGLVGAGLILAGAYLAANIRSRASKTATNNTLAIILVLILVVMRGLYSPMEVFALRETNPIYFNFITSLLCAPLVLPIMYSLNKWRRQKTFSLKLSKQVKNFSWALIFIGATYTINLTATYAAKLIADNAAYVTTIKSAQLLPMVLIGVFFYKEKIIAKQWVGLSAILAGLIFFAFA